MAETALKAAMGAPVVANEPAFITPDNSQAAQPSIAIIGTGFSGLCAAIRLKRAGFDNFVIYEKGGDFGGVWRENTYPGAACDVPWHLYSFSFEYSNQWSSRYPPQPEILKYIRACARKYGLYEHCRFNTEVESAAFDKDSGRWSVATKDGDAQEYRAVITGVGQLSRPAFPRIKGIEDFRGHSFHSALWDHDCNLKGKRVAVIGTGASAIQFIPEIAPEVSQLTIFQRSAPYILPRLNLVYGAVNKFLFRFIPRYGHLYRLFLYELGDNSIAAFNGKGLMSGLFKWWAQHHLKSQVPDPELRAKLTPDYPVGCKRVLFHSDYYPALTRDNVEVETTGISHISQKGVVTTDGVEHEVDVIIYGTGFKATEFLAPINFRGKDGQTLEERWSDGAEAYLGVSVDGFPNLFMCYGPNTNLGSNSIIFMIECQTHYITQCIRKLADGRTKYLDVKPGVLREFNDVLQDKLKASVWSAGCSSWYHTDDGRVTNNWPNKTKKYQRLTRKFRLDDYQVALQNR